MDAYSPCYNDGHHHSHEYYPAVHLLHFSPEVVGTLCHCPAHLRTGYAQLSGGRQVGPHLLPHACHHPQFTPVEDAYFPENMRQS